MNKVTTINLNGNAYQLEEGGYELLKKYLDTARKNLGDDLDRDEILADFERAIAEKCAVHLNSRKSVITEKEVKKIIDDMGPVESAEDDKKHKEEHDDESDSRPKRLYTLRDGAIIGGVANGLAAYFNIDVTIVRLVFVLLVFVSGGFWMLVYLLMMLIVPEAQTPEQKAELRGEKFSAQQVLDRAKQKYADLSDKERWHKLAEEQRPALSNLGNLLEKLVRVLSLAIGIVIALLLGAFTAAWISGLWWLAFGHPVLQDQLSTISLWTIAAAMTAAYFILALPVAVIMAGFLKLGLNRQFGRQSAHWLLAVALVWVASIGVAIGVAATTSGRLSAYQATHGYIQFDRHQICINSDICGGSQNYIQPGGPVCSKTSCPVQFPLPPQLHQIY